MTMFEDMKTVGPDYSMKNHREDERTRRKNQEGQMGTGGYKLASSTIPLH